MLLYVITSWGVVNGASTWTATAVTDAPSHLFLVWTLTPPVLEPRYRVRRGVLTECGLTWRWTNTSCTEQAEPGLSTTHTFVTAYPPEAPILAFMTVADACALPKPTSSTPPITQLLDPQPIGPAFVFLTNPQTLLLNNTSFIALTWQQALYSGAWTPIPPPVSSVTPPTPGNYISNIRIEVNSTAAFAQGNLRIRDTLTSTIFDQIFVNWGGGTTTFTFVINSFPALPNAIAAEYRALIGLPHTVNPPGAALNFWRVDRL